MEFYSEFFSDDENDYHVIDQFKKKEIKLNLFNLKGGGLLVKKFEERNNKIKKMQEIHKINKDIFQSYKTSDLLKKYDDSELVQKYIIFLDKKDDNHTYDEILNLSMSMTLDNSFKEEALIENSILEKGIKFFSEQIISYFWNKIKDYKSSILPLLFILHFYPNDIYKEKLEKYKLTNKTVEYKDKELIDFIINQDISSSFIEYTEPGNIGVITDDAKTQLVKYVNKFIKSSATSTSATSPATGPTTSTSPTGYVTLV